MHILSYTFYYYFLAGEDILCLFLKVPFVLLSILYLVNHDWKQFLQAI